MNEELIMKIVETQDKCLIACLEYLLGLKVSGRLKDNTLANLVEFKNDIDRIGKMMKDLLNSPTPQKESENK